MRILYIIMSLTFPYALKMFFRRIKTVNAPKQFFGRTIYVSNHPASFMDPIMIPAFTRPIVFFMTRSDVFTKLLKPFFWACHMLPIYRQQDEGDGKAKNEKVFETCSRLLKYGRNLLIFGEGFTDDVFIRRLKPVKKGAVRIGFTTLENINWKKKIYIAAVGCNYTKPNQMRSDFLISYSDKICLNDYKEEYLEHPSKVITELTKHIERLMQEQITHVQKRKLAPFHEMIMMITRKGMNPDSYDKSISLVERWKYSQRLANWLNTQDLEENEELDSLHADTENYFKLLKRVQLEDKYVFWKTENPSGSRAKELLYLFLFFPFALIGLIHCFIPYFFIKRFVEKSFKRKVFWGSSKLVMGKLTIGLLNIPLISVFYHYVYPSWWLAIGYYSTIGLTGLAAYMWFTHLKTFRTKGIVNNTNVEIFIIKRDKLKNRIQAFITGAVD